MKTRHITLITALLLVFSSSALALTIDNGAIDVGNLDGFIKSEFLSNPKPINQLTFINNTVPENYDLTTFRKWEDIAENSFTKVDGSNNYFAFDFGYAPEYFLIKTGHGQSTHNHFLYKNDGNIQYAVFDYNFQNDISHISAVGSGSPSVPVPEPGTLLLFGAGIAGLFLYRRQNR